jgi:hypothetical protein
VRVEPVDQEALEDEAARERVEREQRGDAVDEPARRKPLGAGGRRLHGQVRQPHVEEGLHDPRESEEPEEETVP